jgi:hypothetical protein
MRSIFVAAPVLAAVMLGSSVLLAAQPPGGMRGQPRYDASTEVTLNGTVQNVKTVEDTVGKPRKTGTHLVVKTDSETIEVHLGPTAFITDQKLSLQNGDVVSIVGSRVKVAGSDAVIARQIRKGEQTVTLRDAQGIPKWSRGPR